MSILSCMTILDLKYNMYKNIINTTQISNNMLPVIGAHDMIE